MPDPFRRIRDFFRKPAMIGTPPSQRPMWHDPAAHAKDFALRYATELDYAVSQRMMELGIPTDQMGAKNIGYGPPRLAFQPHGVEGGNVEGTGEIIVDSGLLNDDMLKKDYGKKAGRLFERARLQDRLDAILAHEYEEHRHGMSHEAALKAAPKTDLPISHEAREIVKAMEKGWRGR
jgi:hypothetical protein